MSADHKRPLYAFVIVAIMCALIIANALRSQAVMGVLQAGAAQVVHGTELHPQDAHRQPGRPVEAPVLTVPAPVAPTATTERTPALAPAPASTAPSVAPGHASHPHHPVAGHSAPGVPGASPGHHPGEADEEKQGHGLHPTPGLGPVAHALDHEVKDGLAHAIAHGVRQEIPRGLGHVVHSVISGALPPSTHHTGPAAHGPRGLLGPLGRGHGHGLALGHALRGPGSVDAR
jgi:hypothetical protein